MGYPMSIRVFLWAGRGSLGMPYPEANREVLWCLAGTAGLRDLAGRRASVGYILGDWVYIVGVVYVIIE
jgi:hypothetical protein